MAGPTSTPRLPRGRCSLRQSQMLAASATRKCPCQESNLIRDLRRVACDPPHPKDDHKSQIPITPPGNRTQSDGLKVRYADHHTGEVLRDLKLQISNLCTTPPRSRTSSDSFERCRAAVTLAGRLWNSQIPKFNVQGMTKTQVLNPKPTNPQAIASWVLVIEISLDIGAWKLGFPHQSRRQDSHLHPLVYETSAF